MMKRILVIDDDKGVLDAIEDVLSYAAYQVKAIDNANDLFNVIEEFKPDLIVMDYLLTGINGGEFCHQIKSTYQTAHIPVIIMSGFARVFQSLGNYKCDCFIPKPFNLNDLLQKVEQCLQLSEYHS